PLPVDRIDEIPRPNAGVSSSTTLGNLDDHDLERRGEALLRPESSRDVELRTRELVGLGWRVELPDIQVSIREHSCFTNGRSERAVIDIVSQVTAAERNDQIAQRKPCIARWAARFYLSHEGTGGNPHAENLIQHFGCKRTCFTRS